MWEVDGIKVQNHLYFCFCLFVYLFIYLFSGTVLAAKNPSP